MTGSRSSGTPKSKEVAQMAIIGGGTADGEAMDGVGDGTGSAGMGMSSFRLARWPRRLYA